MNYIQIREAYLFYNNLNNKNKFFSKFIQCSRRLSYNRDNCMM